MRKIFLSVGKFQVLELWVDRDGWRGRPGKAFGDSGWEPAVAVLYNHEELCGLSSLQSM